jgi:acylphosphatase
MHELHAIVSGRVQMVMMRDFVCRKAHSLELLGYVKNLSDGTVEVVAQGDRKALEDLGRSLYKGSLFARVDNVQVIWRKPSAQYSAFTIDYSA